MSPGSRAALVLPLLVLLGVLVAGHAVATPLAADATRPSVAQPQAPQPQVDDPDATAPVTMVVDLRAGGDARWRVSTTFNLTSDADREAFSDLARSFEDGEGSTLGLQAFGRASQETSAATGREMAIVDVERDATVENDTGRLTLAFTWTNFARVDGDRLHVDDVFETRPAGETWLPGLDAGDRLVVRAPEGYGVAAASTAPERRENRSVLVWTGPETFEADELRAEFTGQGLTDTPTATPPTDPGQSVPWLLVFVLGLTGGVVAYLFVRHRDDLGLPSTPTGGDDAGGETPAPAAADAAPAAGAATDDEASEEAESGEIDEALLSDEERVERLLERNGGRMKQANIVKETGWSNAKVSQLLSAMEGEGRIDKLRIGRENLISFPEEDVTDLEE
jgi:hypothetical protein